MDKPQEAPQTNWLVLFITLDLAFFDGEDIMAAPHTH